MTEQLRLCVSCRQLKPRVELVRLMREGDPLTVTLFFPGESDRRRFGRSAYVCAGGDCIRQALKGRRLAKALKTPIPDAIVDRLQSVKGP